MNEKFFTSVDYAIESGNTQLFDFLLAKVFSSLSREEKEYVIHKTIKDTPDTDFIQHVLDHGFELSFKDEDDNTLLHYAAYSNNVETIKFFLKRGLDVNTENKMGINPLQFAALNTSNVDVIKELISAGGDIKIRNSIGQTLLAISAGYNPALEITQFFIDQGLDIEARDDDGATPILTAAQYQENPDVIELLINAGADIDAKDNDGDTMFHLAAQNESLPVVYYVSSAFSTYLADNDGVSCLSKALIGAVNPEVIKLYIRKMRTEHVMFASRNEVPEILEALIQEGYDVNAANSDGCTVLMFAAMMNTNPDIIRMLIYYNAVWNTRDENGRTPLHYAASNPDSAIYDWMLEDENFKTLADVKDSKGKLPEYYLTHKDEF